MVKQNPKANDPVEARVLWPSFWGSHASHSGRENWWIGEAQVRGHSDNIGNCSLNCPWSCYWDPSWGWQLLRTGGVQGKGSNTEQRESKSEMWLRGRSVSHKLRVQGTLMWRREMEQQPEVTKGKPIPPCLFVNWYEPLFYRQVTSAHVFILSHA